MSRDDMTEEEMDEMTTRQSLVYTASERLMWLNRRKEAGEVFTVAQLAALIVDDLMASAGMAAIIERTTMNSLASGREQGLREALGAVTALKKPRKEELWPKEEEVEASSPTTSLTA